MKGLFLVLMLSPLMLFGQARQKALVDSVRAASNNIQKVSGLINKYHGTNVEEIHVSDSDEYVTLVVRIHATEATRLPILAIASVVEVKMADIVAEKLSPVIVPPPPFIFIPESINALPVSGLIQTKIRDIVFDTPYTVTLPPLPLVKVDMETLPVTATVQMRMEDIVFEKLNAVTLPPLPLIKVEMEEMSLAATIAMKTDDIVFDKIEMVIAPPLPLVKVEMEELQLLTAVQMKIEDIVPDKVDPVELPPPPEIEPNIVIPLAPAVTLPIVIRPFGKLHPVAAAALVVEKEPVSEMHLSDEGYSLLEKMEGFSPELYNLGDGGYTIGFGFFVSFSEADKWRKGVTMDDAEQIIRQKVLAYEDQVKRYINVPLTQEQFDALTMLAYNLGGFSKATSIVNDINTNADFEKLQHDWMRFVHSKAPNVMKGLMNRRNDELQVKNEANYQPERKILIFKSKK